MRNCFMPRKKNEIVEEDKKSTEVKPKRKRRTPAEMAIFRAEQERKILPQKILQLKKLLRKFLNLKILQKN